VKNQLELVKPENLYIVLGLIFGLIFVIITPPFQAPDEPYHFYRAYQISDLQILSQPKFSTEDQIETAGGYLPISIGNTVHKYQNIMFQPAEKHIYTDTIKRLNDSLNLQEKVFTAFPASAVYTPIPYIPQAIGISIGKVFNLSPLLLMYLGRIFNLLFIIVTIYYAIKIIPFFKWTLLLLSSIPLSMFIFSSLSADVLTIGVSYFFIAYVLHISRRASFILKPKNYLLLSLLVLALVLSKSGYSLLPALLLIIPNKTYGNIYKKVLFIGILAVISLILLVIWTNATEAFYISTTKSSQLEFIANNPLQYLKIFLATYYYDGLSRLQQMAGSLGWLDSTISGLFHFLPFLIITILTVLYEQRKVIPLNLLQKLIIFLISLGTIFIISTTLFIFWDGNTDNSIELQGRYFIPILPLIPLIFMNQKLFLVSKLKNIKIYFILWLIFSSTLTLLTLIHRYY